MKSRRSGMVLVLVLLSLALAAAFILPLVLASSTQAVLVWHRSDRLRHDLAVDSVIAAIPDLVTQAGVRRDLDRSNRVVIDNVIGPVRVQAVLQDDSVKLPIPMLGRLLRREALPAALRELAMTLPLPMLRVRAVPSPPGSLWTGCLEDLFVDPTDDALYGSLNEDTTWCQYVTPVGETLSLPRAAEEVVEAALLDLERGLGRRLARLQRQYPQRSLAELCVDLELSEPQRREVMQRFGGGQSRYSLLIHTSIGNDRRAKYVICDGQRPTNVMVSWEVAP